MNDELKNSYTGAKVAAANDAVDNSINAESIDVASESEYAIESAST